MAEAGKAHANGRFPSANQLVVTPGRPDRLVLRATFGLLITEDRGATWNWVCERAIGYSGVQDPAIAVVHGGAVVAGLVEGLSVSSPSACAWSFANAIPRSPVVDVVVRRDDPSVVYALTAAPAGFDRGYRFDSQLHVSKDSGATWTRFGAALDSTLLPLTFDVSASEPLRFYVSAIRSPETVPANGVLLVGDGEPNEWTERRIPVDPSEERSAFVAAVDPGQPDRLYVRTGGGPTGRLFVSRDAGRTFDVIFSGGPLRGFALSPDGARVFVGGPSDGLHVAARTDLAFSKRSSQPIECLMVTAAALFACSTDAAGFSVARSEDEGASFAPLLKLADIPGPRTCPDFGACDDQWPTVRDALLGLGDSGTDAGERVAPDAGPAARVPRSRCTCEVVGAPVGAADVGWFAVAVTLAAWRARSRSRSTTQH